jgi:hypothetical protein
MGMNKKYRVVNAFIGTIEICNAFVMQNSTV